MIKFEQKNTPVDSAGSTRARGQIADAPVRLLDPEQIDQLVRFASEIGAEEVFVEPVNPRGQGLKTMQEILKSKGYHFEAAHIESIRNKEDWSWYVTRLIKNTQKSMCKFYNIQRLRFLLYPSRLTTQDFASIKKNDKGNRLFKDIPPEYKPIAGLGLYNGI